MIVVMSIVLCVSFLIGLIKWIMDVIKRDIDKMILGSIILCALALLINIFNTNI